MWWHVFLVGTGMFLVSPAAAAAESPILINELFYDVPGSDTGNEWIELVNVGGDPVDLSGWKIQRGGTSFTTAFTFPDGATIGPGQLLLVGEANVAGAAYTGTLTFQNGGSETDGVRLVARDDTVRDITLYDKPNTNALPDTEGNAGTVFAPDVLEGHSLARIPDGARPHGDSRDFADVSSPTPGAPNGSKPAPSSPSAVTSPSSPSASRDPSQAAAVVVSEVLPNPVGGDTDGEFIELWNRGASVANVSGFLLDDAEGGSKPYTIPPGTTLPAGGYRAFSVKDTKLTFNNDADHARLLRSDGTVQDELVYDDVPGEGWALAQKPDGSAAWTHTPTSGAANQFSASSPRASPSVSASPSPAAPPRSTKTPAVSGRARGATTSRGGPARTSRSLGTTREPAASRPSVRGGSATATPDGTGEVEDVPIADVRTKELGTHVRVRGVVSATPGVIDPRVLYLAGSGIGVIVVDGTLPELAVGDEVTVTGTLVEPRKERFIAVASASDVTKGSAAPPPEPHTLAMKDIGESWEGSLVRLSGRVEEADERMMKFADDSGDVVVAVPGEASWVLPRLRVGAEVQVVGILSELPEGFRVIPRSASDVTPTAAPRAAPPLWKRPFVLVALACFLAAGGLFLLHTRPASLNLPSS